MWKPLLLLAVMANTFFIKPSEGSSYSMASASSSSFTSSKGSSASTSSYSSSSSYSNNPDNNCSTGKPTRPPFKCPKNEVFDLCPAPCPPRECGVNPALILCAVPPKVGDPECKPGCRCRDDYLRNYDGVCVPKDECPRCPRNEVYDECPAPCPPRRCDVDERLIRCAAPPKPGDPDCEPGCRCADGYLRNNNEVCVLRDQCPRCPKNEVYDECPAPCPPRRCDVDERVISCAPPPKPGDPSCQPGCRCVDGYVRNNEGICVTRDQCPKCTKPHEVWDSCPRSCPPQTCDSLFKSYSCPRDPKKNCKGACRCEPGYYRNILGECISEENCRKCCGPHEYFSCGGACDNVCATLSQQNQTNCHIYTYACVPMCYCEANYARDDNNICIPIDQCPVPQCGKHEIYSKCPSFEHRPLHCSKVGFPVEYPPTDGPCPVEPACVCDYGYVKNDSGVCIPIEECPSCGGDPNAVSGCGVNCGRHCSNYKEKDVACIQVCYENACDCREGFVMDDNIKRCVPPKNCTPICGVNEVYSNCTNGGCGPKECSGLGLKIGCVKMDQKYCKEGCICKEGYLRDDNGKCIPKGECPACGGDPNAVTGCGINCGRLCSNYNKGPVACAAVCYDDGCDCRKGFVLDENTGLCVRPKNCTPVCKKNEVFSTCVNGGCGAKKCSQLGKPIPCVKPKKCINGCLCKEGWLRADNGTCIPKEQCPQRQCGKNERFEQCPDTLCTPQNCSQLGFPWPAIPCPPPGDGPCPGPPGCVCIDDYVRDDQGKCIPKTDCPSCGGDPNAVSGCGVNCGRLCSNYDQGPVACPEICYPNACDCRDGFVLDKNIGMCVRPENCTPQCADDERYEECPDNLCIPLACSELGYPINCPTLSGNSSSECPGEPGCICDYGNVRDDYGNCIPKDQCPSCGGDPNAVSGCGINCGRRCSNYKKKNVVCPLICKLNGCDCRERFVYDDNLKKCVLPKYCTPTCGINEVYDTCANGGCRKWTCSQPEICKRPIKCKGGCVCQDGYTRAENGTCIPINECPEEQCGENERYEKCPDTLCTPQNCSQLGFPWPAIPCPPPGDGPCPGPPACVCIDDYVRDDQGKCIPKKDCPSCGGDPNAVSGCGVNCGRLCSNYDQGPVPCPKICYPNACDCRDGFVLDENTGMCVRPEECKKCYKPHQYWDACAPRCPPQTCESIDRQYICPPEPLYCRGACRCEEGYYRNKNGDCITEKECKKCIGPHEYFACGGACDNVCATINKQNQTNCLIMNVKCNEMCYCETGYARNDEKICIPIDECPAPLCHDDERYEECPDSICEPLACSELGFPLDCLILSDSPNVTCPGKPGCVCDYGNVRDDKGKCIPRDQCPSCGGDPNAVSGCGGNCGRRCLDYKEPNVVSPLICMLNGCDCKEGFVYDDNLKKCVCPEDCTSTCGINEVYSNCANGGCRKWKCSEPIICSDPGKCEGGCVCQDGYTRAKNGTCIPENQCPGQCNKPHEYYNECAQTCPPQTCESIGKIYHCPIQPAVCKGACVCEDGYYRNKKGECISEEDCTPLCPDGQRYEECPDFLCEPLACSELGFPIDCPDLTNNPNATCPVEPGCVCDYGNVRDDYGNCIPKNQCPSCGGDPNAVSGCGGNCGRRCSDYKKPNVACPLMCMLNGCDCSEGFVYDDNLHKCVRPENCTPTCGINEVYSNCANGGCRKWKCSEPTICIYPLICEEGCVCQKGYTRAENGTCISENQCPVPECGPNERYEQCPDALCTPQTCSQLGFPISCPAIEDDTGCPGLPSCVCDYGYVRDDDGICIPAKDCPSCGGDPNAVTGCGINCGRLCSNYDKGPVPCPKICKFNACDCRKGYVLDQNINKCVSPKQCTPICGKDEVYSECINGGCQRKNCSQLGKPVPCVKINPKDCIKGCLCKEKYLRAKNGTCIPEDQCPEPKCGKGQRYVKCPEALCAPLTCSEVGFPVPCPDLPQNGACPGSPDCVCNDSYVKDANGNCIPWNKCPSCGGDPNAVSGCGDHTGNRCSDYKKNKGTDPLICYYNACDCKKGYVFDDIQSKVCVLPKHCSPTCGNNEVYDTCANGGCDKRSCSQLGEPTLCIDPIKCQGGCVCKPRYLRAKNGTCILEAQCPDPCKKPNEVYDPCPPIYPPQTCESIGKAYPCPMKSPGSPDYCNGACRCEDGYYRNKIGECISKKDCLKCMGPNEYFSCGGACDNVCATLQKQNQTSCPIINKTCNPKCYCEEGYARDGNNICIPIEQCGEEQCGENERYEKCPDTLCTPQNCSQLGYPWPAIPCPPPGDSPCPGPPACVCIDDYVRDDQGNCIPKKNCPSCGGDPNAVSGCGVNCGKLCSNYDKGPARCPQICYPNACDCREGFVLDENIGKCVRPEECTPQCADDERYEECPDNLCIPLACSELGYPINCPTLSGNSSSECPGEPGCICDYGNVRDDYGNCIPKDQCPSCGGDPNAVSGCGVNCGRLCSNYDQGPVPCPEICYPNACDCRDGFVLDENIRMCVHPENCKKCTGPHEYFACGGACDNVCATINKQNQTYCPIQNIQCNNMCYCETGYARNNENICIPIDECPAPQCADDERYEECPDNLCIPLACSELGYPINCPTLSGNSSSECPGEPGCICDYGNVRDDYGNCIPKDQCPSCGGDPNAVSGCGVNCGRLCSNYDQGPVPCPKICYPHACDCRDGFVLDENIGMCVHPENCTPQCADDERYEECPDNLCIPLACSELGYPINCPTLSGNSSSECPGEPGCICDYGNVRDDYGNCIPKDQCPSCGGDANAVSGCGVNCGRLCSNYDQGPVPCPKICYPNACDCRDGFVLDENIGMCVHPENCTPQCADDERYEESPDNLCIPLACSELGYPINCPTLSGNSSSECPGEPGCICDYGNVRDDYGNCIPKDQCPSCGGDPNAVSGCGVNCGRLCSNYDQGPVPCPEICYPNACDCRDGFVLDENIGMCVHPENCKKCTGPHEYFACGGACDNVCATINKQNQTYCPIQNIQCNNMCYCETGYARNDENICIPIDECPAPQCADDERYEECPDNLCIPLACSELGYPINCPTLSGNSSSECPGEPGCICDYGNVRDDYGNCIPKDQCPSCGGDPNAVSGCGVNCGRLCSIYDQGPAPCPEICYPNACDCRDGFVLDENIGMCVHPENCKKCTGPHEYFACGGACDNVCATINKQNQTYCPIQNIQCNNMCYCETGYARNDENICIPIDECPAPQCADDERYEECPDNLCIPLACSELGYPINCPTLSGNSSSECPGEPGCICDYGNVRDDYGNCIPKDQCPSCGGDPNAVSGCGVNCGRLCSIYDQGPVPCPEICYPNACDCRDGFVLDENIGMCVHPENCKKCTGPHEYFACGGACDNVCATINKQNQTYCPIQNIQCNNKCYCETGYARNDENICIPIDECPASTCGINEVYSNCANGGCRKWKCSEPIICYEPGKCEGSCVCQDGYTRAKNGTCIPENQCRGQCNKPHEYYNECAPTCPPQSCESIGKIYNCSIQPAVCKGACVCEDGYYRNKKGECISENDCKKCTGPHEYFSCGVACDNVCATLNKQNQTSCPIINIVCNRMCYCEKDYARDENNICIPIDKCPAPLCPDDQRYEECPDFLREPLDCSELGFPIDFPDLTNNPNATCPLEPGCVCDYGNVRDDYGNCIPKNHCPSCGGDPNAVSGCGGNCGRRCSDYKKPNVACPLICMPNGCDCREGFVYDDNLHKCVRPENCTPTRCITEVYSNCANGGCRKRKCSEPTICREPLICEEGCVCQKGYTRAENGTCIPENQPVPECGPNEKYEQCPDALCIPQTCSQLGFPISCPAIANDTGCPGLPGCVCGYGYVRNDHGICIPAKDCPSCGGDPNAVTGCGINCGRLCSNYDKGPVPCPKICKFNACNCRKGYVLDQNINKCVSPKQCTPICGIDEVYSECINGGCQRKNCSQIGKPVPCVKIDPKDCIKGCLCKEKYLRAKNGTCIPEDQCPAPPDGYGSSSSTPMNNTDIKARLDKGAFSLSGEFIYQLSQSKLDENFVCSATSVLPLLAQIALFAKGVVLEQLLAVQNLKNVDEEKSIYRSLIDSYQNQQKVEFGAANKFYFNQNYKLSDNFQEVSQKYFNSTGQNIDFSKYEDAAKIINDYVSNRTRNKIQNLVSPDALNAETIVVLVNAIYYKGNWLHQFNPNDTQKRVFTKRDKSDVELYTMYQENTFNYTENNDMKIQALEMQYENKNFSFLVILPEEGYFDQTVQACRDPEVIMGIINRLSSQTVQVYMPKLLITTNMDMGKMLREANVSKMFDPNSDGFQGILAEDNKPLYVSAAVQQVYLECDETGSKAAAATDVTVGLATAAIEDPPPIFEANRSFIFYLLFKRVPLFCGGFVGAE